MKEFRKLPKQEPRIETGVVEFGDDWKGIYLRGDDAMAYGILIDQMLQNKKNLITEIQLKSLVELLFSCKENNF